LGRRIKHFLPWSFPPISMYYEAKVTNCGKVSRYSQCAVNPDPVHSTMKDLCDLQKYRILRCYYSIQRQTDFEMAHKMMGECPVPFHSSPARQSPWTFTFCADRLLQCHCRARRWRSTSDRLIPRSHPVRHPFDRKTMKKSAILRSSLRRQADVKGGGGTWKDLTDNVNFVAGTRKGLTDNVNLMAGGTELLSMLGLWLYR
jgi:hypothetical protein